MSVRKLDYTLKQRDPDKMAQLKAVIDEMWPMELAELRALAGHTHIPKSVETATNGRQWLREKSAAESTLVNRDNRKVAKINLLVKMIDVTITPQSKTEETREQNETDKKRQAVRDLLSAIDEGSNEEYLTTLHDEFDGKLNIPVPKSVRDRDKQ